MGRVKVEVRNLDGMVRVKVGSWYCTLSKKVLTETEAQGVVCVCPCQTVSKSIRTVTGAKLTYGSKTTNHVVLL